MVILSYGPLRFSTVNDVSVFTITGVLERVLVEDCGGHSYALEILLGRLPELTQHGNDFGSERNAYIMYIKHRYMCVVPKEKDAVIIVKTALANRYLKWEELIPGTYLTLNDICP